MNIEEKLKHIQLLQAERQRVLGVFNRAFDEVLKPIDAQLLRLETECNLLRIQQDEKGKVKTEEQKVDTCTEEKV